MASVRLMFLLSLGLWDMVPEVLAELVTCTTGLAPVGAETLLVMLLPARFPVPGTTPLVVMGTEDAVLMGVAVVASAAVETEPPTAYIPMLWLPSPSAPLEDTVEVPVVPELGDGCLQVRAYD
ncbi:hypothetical protein KM043_011380 [Ampulex compressa]|nr:hypothetical protein KM043_011380 [Ampulex compressa]